MSGLEVLPAWILSYESKSVTQQEVQRRAGVRRAAHKMLASGSGAELEFEAIALYTHINFRD